MDNATDTESSHLARRVIAFAIDVLFAACIAMAIPSLIAEASNGRYRLTGAPGFAFTSCNPSLTFSESTVAVINRTARSFPSYAPPKVESCTTHLNLVARNTFIRMTFPAIDRPGGMYIYRIATDFSGEPVQVIPLNDYVPFLEAIFALVFLAGALVDSLGMRVMQIRVRSLTGEKPDYAALIARYGTMAIAFSPFWLPFGDTLTSTALVAVAGTVLLFPWYKGSLQQRRGLHDNLARTMIVDVVPRMK